MDRTKKVKAKDSGDDTIPGTSPKLDESQGECPYPILSFLLVVKKEVVVMK